MLASLLLSRLLKELLPTIAVHRAPNEYPVNIGRGCSFTSAHVAYHVMGSRKHLSAQGNLMIAHAEHSS